MGPSLSMGIFPRYVGTLELIPCPSHDYNRWGNLLTVIVHILAIFRHLLVDLLDDENTDYRD